MLRIKKLLPVLILFTLIGSVFAQEKTSTLIKVKGKVFDASTKAPIDGINVAYSGFEATFTDSTGTFSIDVPSDRSTLTIGGLDYQPQRIALKSQTDIKVYLYETGYKSFHEYADQYYSQYPLAYTTQSVVSLDFQNNNWKNPGTSAEHVFKGEVPGLNIIQRSGVPGSGSNMFMRGFSSLYGTNQPIIVLDGMIYSSESYQGSIINGYVTNPLSFIDINDIDNITVIKDAASIYGGRSSNGVILIRTNHASKMATSINVTGYGGVSFAPKNKISLLNSEQYRIYLAEMMQSSGLSADSIRSSPYMSDDTENPQYFRYHNNSNWQDMVFQNSRIQGYKMKISGGDDVALYAISIGYLNHEGIVKNTNYNRYSVRFNSDINISSKITINSNISFVYNQNSMKPEGSSDTRTNPIYLSLIKAPFLYPRVISSSGAISPNLENADLLGIGNPVAIAENLDALSTNYRIFGSVNGNYKINKDLVLSNLVGFTFDKIRESLFVPHLGVAPEILGIGIAENKMAHLVERLFSINNDLRLKYTKTFATSHNFSAFAGIRTGINKTEGDWGFGYNSPNDQMRSVGTGLNSFRTVSGYLGSWNWATVYGSAEYNYQQRYFLTANFSLDGSSRYGDEAKGLGLFHNKFGIFPSVSAAWLVSSEKFFANVNSVDLLKFRLSYGLTGNDDIGNYSAMRYYKSQNFLGAQGLVAGDLWNPKLQWETVKKSNAGIDMGLLKERLNISLDVFSNTTQDLLNILPADRLTGFDYYMVNSGSFKSSGVELAINGRMVNTSFKWDMGLNISTCKTKVLEFPGDNSGMITEIMGANILTKVGGALGAFYGYKTDGVFSTQAEANNSGLRALMPNTDLVPFSAGDVKFVDMDGNKIIDKNDMQVIGDPNPKLKGMFTNAFTLKGVTLEAALAFNVGNDVFNQLRYTLESMQNFNNQTSAVVNRWRTEGQVTNVPKAEYGDPIGNSRFSDRWIEDGSYLRLQYVTLSYKLPVKSSFVNAIQIYVTGQNLVTWTKYLGMDPEFSYNKFSLSQGIDIGLTPQPGTVTAGIRIGL